MPTREDIIRFAKAQVGVHESPAGSNRVKYSEWYGVIGPWCAMFVSWVLNAKAQVGWHVSTEKGASYVPSVENWARARGLWRSSRLAKPGDLVIYDFYGQGYGVHIGFVYKNNPLSGSIVALEGNTSISSQDNGGEVMERERSRSLIRGTVNMSAFYAEKPRRIRWRDGHRPKWAGDNKPDGHLVLRKGDHGENVRHMQHLLLRHGRNIVVDGDFGEGTDRHLRAFQDYHEMTVDGVCGKRSWELLHHDPTPREHRRFLRIRSTR